jgi:hypothetical protein
MAIIRKHASRHTTASGEISSVGARLNGDVVFLCFSIGQMRIELSEAEIRSMVQEWRGLAKDFNLELEAI